MFQDKIPIIFPQKNAYFVLYVLVDCFQAKKHVITQE